MLTAIPLLASVFALVTGAAAAAGVRRVLALVREFPGGTYRVVIGMHPAVPAILEELVRAGDAVVLVADVDPGAVPDRVHLIRRDPTQPDALRAARPAGAQHVLITGPTDGDVLVSAVLLRKEAPDVPVSALVRSRSVGEALRDLGIHQAVSADEPMPWVDSDWARCALWSAGALVPRQGRSNVMSWMVLWLAVSTRRT